MLHLFNYSDDISTFPECVYQDTLNPFCVVIEKLIFKDTTCNIIVVMKGKTRMWLTKKDKTVKVIVLRNIVAYDIIKEEK